MKTILFGHESKDIKPLVEKLGFELVEKSPELVICYGGDGTLMKGEASFPGVMKVLLRGSSRICKLCSSLPNEEVLERIIKGEYKTPEFFKLEAEAKGKTFRAINDITVHNKDARHAIRYRLWVGDKPIGGEIIGDGIVASTPLGSTGYYRSITDSYFEVGIGLAFNNSTEQSDHIVLKEDSVMKIKIIRGPAFIYADNQEEHIELNDNDEAVVKKSSHSVKIISV